MVLTDLIRAVDALSSDELEALYAHIREQREQRRLVQYTPEQRLQMLQDAVEEMRAGLSDDELAAIVEAMNATDDRHNGDLDVEGLKQIFAELREGFTESDLEELEWAMNVEYVEPLDDDV